MNFSMNFSMNFVKTFVMNLQKSLLATFVVAVSLNAQAQTNATASAPTTTLSVTAEKQPPGRTSSFLLGFKSYNSSARVANLEDDAKAPSKGQVYNGKQEVFVGYRFANDWGGYVQTSQTRQQYNDRNLNRWSSGDPSFTLLHPDFYDSGFLRLRGQFRAYLPYTERSKNQNIQQVAYYFTQIFALGNGQEVFNQVTPRYFGAETYKDTDTTWYFENRTIYTKKLNSWCKLGLGNWLQIEQHQGTATGYASEVIPQVDFMIGSNITFGPRISLPIYSQNVVYDGPKNATLDEARGELFFQASL